MDLSQLSWSLTGWRPYSWRLGKSMETGWSLMPDIAPLPAQVPGSVQNALLQAGILPDWNVGLQSRDCEWVEHRHWDFTTTIQPEMLPEGERVYLVAQGLDYSGWVLVDGKEVGSFSGALVPHEWELTDALVDGKPHQLSLVFDTPPEEQGQIGYTVQSKYFKPRYNYSWDWCPRLVPIGIWDTLKLEFGHARSVRWTNTVAELAPDNLTGSLALTFDVAQSDYPLSVQVLLRDGERVVAGHDITLPAGTNTVALNDLAIAPWWPHNSGPGEPSVPVARQETPPKDGWAQLYDLVVVARRDGSEIWEQTRRVGFKRIEWRQCEGAPEGAEPWICVVNGTPVFLQGVNWTPIHLNYHDTTKADYREILGLYWRMGCNTVRVWGGAYLEKEAFYAVCDELGMLVWQEFPLSSSGIDNWPPEDEAAVAELTRIATSYVQRRREHVSLFLWCGGNELQGALDGGKVGIGKPVGYDHPAIQAMARVVAKEDPGRRFLPASASGPRFNADAKDYGKGLHHDVHGPWGQGDMSLEEWNQYWENDDSLFRSEVGVPGAQSMDLMKQYSGGLPNWPPTTALWHHSSAWWTQWDRFQEELKDVAPEERLEEYTNRTQVAQSRLLEVAAANTKKRFPRCGGFLIWMGHDCFPCLSNTSVIDFKRRFKPAAHALQGVFRRPPGADI